MSSRPSKQFWRIAQHMLEIMYFALLVILFPSLLYITSSGTLDVLKAIPNGYQIWEVSYYVVPAITLVLIVALLIHRRAERRRPERERQRLENELMEVLQQRQAEHDQF